eukprot:jgi/Undpi1/3690/HiC_scaffold_16.g07060.m1
MKSFAVLAMCCAGAQAFMPVPSGSFGVKAAPQRATSSASSSTVMMAKSKALPFLESPATLDGSMIGDFGFDPLGLTENINLPYAAEIKHGRVAMLAIVGFILTQYVHLPGDQFQVGPLEALTSVSVGAQAQVFSFIAVFELASILGTFSGDSNDPWETLLQDPTGSKIFYNKSAAEQERLKLSEVKHSRVAMLAIIGELVQMMMFHKNGGEGKKKGGSGGGGGQRSGEDSEGCCVSNRPRLTFAWGGKGCVGGLGGAGGESSGE